MIRTQPNSKSLCTIEAIALSLSLLEDNGEIAEVRVFIVYLAYILLVVVYLVVKFLYVNILNLRMRPKNIVILSCCFVHQALIRPLRALCKIQLDHGAVAHFNKDHEDEIMLRA